MRELSFVPYVLILSCDLIFCALICYIVTFCACVLLLHILRFGYALAPIITFFALVMRLRFGIVDGPVLAHDLERDINIDRFICFFIPMVIDMHPFLRPFAI